MEPLGAGASDQEGRQPNLKAPLPFKSRARYEVLVNVVVKWFSCEFQVNIIDSRKPITNAFTSTAKHGKISVMVENLHGGKLRLAPT